MSNRKHPVRSLRPDAAKVLDADLGWNSRLAARLITAELDRGLAPLGLTSTQFALMCLIASAADDTLGALAQRAGLNQSTMSRNVDMLARSGWVEIAIVEHDRRRRAMWLTESGAMLLADAIPVWRKGHRDLLAKLEAELLPRVINATHVLSPFTER